MPFSIRPFRRFPVCCLVPYQSGLPLGVTLILREKESDATRLRPEKRTVGCAHSR